MPLGIPIHGFKTKVESQFAKNVVDSFVEDLKVHGFNWTHSNTAPEGGSTNGNFGKIQVFSSSKMFSLDTGPLIFEV